MYDPPPTSPSFLVCLLPDWRRYTQNYEFRISSMAAVSINLQMRQHAFGQTEDSLMYLRIAEFRRQAQRQNRLKAQQQLLEGGVILPGGRLCGEAALAAGRS
jgi:hypothetical protein